MTPLLSYQESLSLSRSFSINFCRTIEIFASLFRVPRPHLVFFQCIKKDVLFLFSRALSPGAHPSLMFFAGFSLNYCTQKKSTSFSHFLRGSFSRLFEQWTPIGFSGSFHRALSHTNYPSPLLFSVLNHSLPLFTRLSFCPYFFLSLILFFAPSMRKYAYILHLLPVLFTHTSSLPHTSLQFLPHLFR